MKYKVTQNKCVSYTGRDGRQWAMLESDELDENAAKPYLNLTQFSCTPIPDPVVPEQPKIVPPVTPKGKNNGNGNGNGNGKEKAKNGNGKKVEKAETAETTPPAEEGTEPPVIVETPVTPVVEGDTPPDAE